MTGLNVNVVKDILCKHIQLPERSLYIKATAGASGFLNICFMKHNFLCNGCYFSFTFPSDRRHERLAGALSGERTRGSIAWRGEGRGPPAPVAVMRSGSRRGTTRSQVHAAKLRAGGAHAPRRRLAFPFPFPCGEGCGGAARRRRDGAVAAAHARWPAACA